MTDNRRNNRGNPGNRGGGRPRLPKTLVINGVIQDGHWTIVSVTPETIVIESSQWLSSNGNHSYTGDGNPELVGQPESTARGFGFRKLSQTQQNDMLEAQAYAE